MPVYDREALITGEFKTIDSGAQPPVQSKFGGVLKDTRSDDVAHRALLGTWIYDPLEKTGGDFKPPPPPAGRLSRSDFEAERSLSGADRPYDPHTKVGKDFQRAAPPPVRAFGTRDLHSDAAAHMEQVAAVTAKKASWMEPSKRR